MIESGSGVRTALALPAIGIAVAVVVVIGLVGIVGIGSARSGRSPDDGATSGAEPVDATRELKGPGAAFDAVVTLDADDDSLRPPAFVKRVAPGSVIEVRGRGFAADVAATIAQCEQPRATGCENVYRFRTDSDGRLRTPYRLAAGPTSLVVEVDHERVASTLGFASRSAPRTALSIEDEALRLANAKGGAAFTIRRCPVSATSLEACDVVDRVRADDAGTALSTIRPARNDQLILAVNSAGVIVTEPLTIAGLPGPTVAHSPVRLLVGLALAFALLELAVMLIRSTDWRVPAEAATPFLDSSVLDG